MISIFTFFTIIPTQLNRQDREGTRTGIQADLTHINAITLL